MNKLKALCCYCGKKVATTRDHIPPKAIFNKPRPSDLITVPCCFECNNEASGHDEKFKTYLGMHVARQGGQAEQFFKRGVLPTVRHNKKLLRKIISNSKNVNVVSTNGIYLGAATSVLWDSEAHDAVIERLVRGLYFHHYGVIIGEKANVKAYWFNGLPSSDLDSYYCNTIGDGAFRYYFNKAIDEDYSSIWLFQFYGGHNAGGFTEPNSIGLP